MEWRLEFQDFEIRKTRKSHLILGASHSRHRKQQILVMFPEARCVCQ